mmetsp:Transcript_25918/g.32629  ORF Transcript_25918/g.32629 Transcript_25918/m.32629 type:complete len:121 (+) Transcript_25918:102-464(+)
MKKRRHNSLNQKHPPHPQYASPTSSPEKKKYPSPPPSETFELVICNPHPRRTTNYELQTIRIQNHEQSRKLRRFLPPQPNVPMYKVYKVDAHTNYKMPLYKIQPTEQEWTRACGNGISIV